MYGGSNDLEPSPRNHYDDYPAAKGDIVNKSIRRVNDITLKDITLPEFKLNMDRNSDDLLR